MTVFDASVLVAALSETTEDGEWAISLWRSSVRAAPEFALIETTNLLRRFESRGRLTAGEANFAHRQLLEMDLRILPFAPLAKRVWELRHTLTAYDGCYVALAERLDCRLATLDRRLARGAGHLCEIVTPPDPADLAPSPSPSPDSR